MEKMTNEKKLTILIIGIIAAVSITVAIIMIVTNNVNDSAKNTESTPAENSVASVSKEEIEDKLKNIQTNFETLAKEIVSDDNKTLKDGYTEEQQQLFNAILSKISEFDTFTTANKDNSEMGEEEYYKQLSEKVTETQELIKALDNDIHTNKEAFSSTFTTLSTLFEKLRNEAYDETGKTLKEQYKQYQSDFDNLVKDIYSLGNNIDTNDKNQNYFDSLTKKGNKITEQLKELAKKANISLE